MSTKKVSQSSHLSQLHYILFDFISLNVEMSINISTVILRTTSRRTELFSSAASISVLLVMNFDRVMFFAFTSTSTYQ